jgi:hypothetical protein
MNQSGTWRDDLRDVISQRTFDMSKKNGNITRNNDSVLDRADLR